MPVELKIEMNNFDVGSVKMRPSKPWWPDGEEPEFREFRVKELSLLLGAGQPPIASATFMVRDVDVLLDLVGLKSEVITFKCPYCLESIEPVVQGGQVTGIACGCIGHSAQSKEE